MAVPAILGWSNGRYARAERKLGAQGLTKDFAANPLKSAMFILLTMFLITAGLGLLCAAWKVAPDRAR
jgi:hypothetical protein